MKKRRIALGLTREQLGQIAEPLVPAKLIEQFEWSDPTPAQTAPLLAALEKAEAERMPPEKIRPRRITLGWSQPNLARKAKVSLITVWKLENGETEANFSILNAIDSALRAGEAQPSVAAELRKRRQAAGQSMADLARLANVDKGTIWAIESGKSRPRARTVKKLYGALDVAPTVLTPEEVRQRRHRLRLMKELAKEARVACSTVRQVEHGRTYKAMTAQRLAKAFDRLGEGKPVPSGELIRQDRESLGWSLEQLARRAGISVQAVWCCERQRREVTLPTLRALERAIQDAKAGNRHQSNTSRLRPRASRSAKVRWTSARGAASRRGSHYNPDSAIAAIYKFCYVEYRLKNRARRPVFNNAAILFGQRAPKEESHVTLYANRHAKYNRLPKYPTAQESAKILAKMGGAQ